MIIGSFIKDGIKFLLVLDIKTIVLFSIFIMLTTMYIEYDNISFLLVETESWSLTSDILLVSFSIDSILFIEILDE